MMYPEELANRSGLFPTQRGRKLWKIGGTFRPFCAQPAVGPPRCDIRPPLARQPKGPYDSIPDKIVDPRPPVPQKPISDTATDLLDLYYRMSAVVMAIDDRVPIDWVAARILGVGRTRRVSLTRRDRQVPHPARLVSPEGARCDAKRADRQWPCDSAIPDGRRVFHRTRRRRNPCQDVRADGRSQIA